MKNKASDRRVSALLVDADEDWLMLIQSVLGKQGVTTVASVNGEDLWEKVSKFHPDIILLDIAMKGGADGETFCRQLKTNRVTAKIPIIMLSSNDNIKMIATRCGADGYLPKTMKGDIIREQIVKILDSA